MRASIRPSPLPHSSEALRKGERDVEACERDGFHRHICSPSTRAGPAGCCDAAGQAQLRTAPSSYRAASSRVAARPGSHVHHVTYQITSAAGGSAGVSPLLSDVPPPPIVADHRSSTASLLELQPSHAHMGDNRADYERPARGGRRPAGSSKQYYNPFNDSLSVRCDSAVSLASALRFHPAHLSALLFSWPCHLMCGSNAVDAPMGNGGMICTTKSTLLPRDICKSTICTTRYLNKSCVGSLRVLAL